MNKKAFLPIISIIAVAIITIPFVSAVKPSNSIVAQDIEYSTGHYLEGQVIPTGFDEYGYNYQSHLFVGSYFNVYSGGAGFPPYTGDDTSYLADNPTAENHWAWPYRDVNLNMKWNDAWLSNKDQDGDGALDRHYDYPSYIGSGAWETNHMIGTNDDGTTWTNFVKIIAVPADAVLDGGIWYTAEGVEIGPAIWGQFAIIEEVINDPSTGDNGISYLSPCKAGFGAYSP